MQLEWKLQVGYGEEIPVTFPTSVRAALGAAGRPLPDGAAVGAVTFRSVIDRADTAGAVGVILTVPGVLGVCDVFVEGRPVGRADSAAGGFCADILPQLTSDVSLIELRFLPETAGRRADCLTDGRYFPPAADPAVLAPVTVTVRTDDRPAIGDIRVVQTVEEGMAVLRISVSRTGKTDDTKVVATLTAEDGKMYYAGLPNGRGELIVPDPVYWWTHDRGAQVLYRLTLTLYHGADAADEVTRVVGLRAVSASAGEKGTFCASLNGEPLRLYGCDFPPLTFPLTETTGTLCSARMADAALAGFNLFRLPADTPPPTEEFLSACDRAGMLVWQVLPPVPTEAAERDAYIRECEKEMYRCMTHPSFAFVTLEGVMPDAAAVAALRAAAPGVFLGQAGEITRGDGKTVLHDRTDGADTDAPGVAFCRTTASYPDVLTVRETLPADDGNLFGKTMEEHALGHSLPDILAAAGRRYPFPSGARAATLVSQFAAADAVEAAVTAARRGTPGNCLLLDRLHDPWFAVSPSFLDCAGRRKAACYAAGHATVPVSLDVRTGDSRVTFTVHNDTRRELTGANVAYEILDASGTRVDGGTFAAETAPFSHAEVGSIHTSSVLFGHERSYFLSAWLDDGRCVIDRKLTAFAEPRFLRLEDPGIRMRVEDRDGRPEVMIAAARPAFGVWIYFDDGVAAPDDNFLSLTAGSPMCIPVTVYAKGQTAELLGHKIHVLSLYDLQKNRKEDI